MILLALTFTALTKPLVLLFEKFSSDTSDVYSFADLHLAPSGITETLRRASRMVYGTNLPAEWTLPAIEMTDITAIPEEGGGDEERAHHDAISSEQVAIKSPADPAAAFRAAYFWYNMTSSTAVPAREAAAHAGAATAAAPTEDDTPSSASAQGHRSAKFRQISQVEMVVLGWGLQLRLCCCMQFSLLLAMAASASSSLLLPPCRASNSTAAAYPTCSQTITIVWRGCAALASVVYSFTSLYHSRLQLKAENLRLQVMRPAARSMCHMTSCDRPA
jgi:hypothetical protein